MDLGWLVVMFVIWVLELGGGLDLGFVWVGRCFVFWGLFPSWGWCGYCGGSLVVFGFGFAVAGCFIWICFMLEFLWVDCVDWFGWVCWWELVWVVGFDLFGDLI